MHTSTAGYIYIATSEGCGRSFVGVSASLLDMEWIVKYGVNDLVWFQGYADITLAQARADQLSDMSEDQRRSLIRNGNPTLVDLSPRIWGSDEEEA
jgi:hypothetical protein